MPEAIIIDWYGPYESKNDLKAEAKGWADGTCTLYMGVQSYGRVGYIGLTEGPRTRFDNHEKLAHPDNRFFFIGEIATRGASGRRIKKHRTDHAAAEHALIAYMQPPLNSRLVERDLKDCCVVFSRFFSKNDYETPIDVLPKFPRIVAYDSYREEFVAGWQ